MITSGIVITLNADAALARQAQATLQARPELTLGELNVRWLPVALEAADVGASRDFHDWLNTVPGVDFVDVVEVNFGEEEGLQSHEVCVNTRPHPGPLPQERGKRSPSHSKTRGGIARMSRREPEDGRSLFPLPGGEGQGEGERQTTLLPQSKTLDVAAGIPACRRAEASLPGGESVADNKGDGKIVSSENIESSFRAAGSTPSRQAEMPAATSATISSLKVTYEH